MVNMDKIIIKGLRIYAYHGVNPEEKEKGQPFELDITMYLPLNIPGKTDNVEDTVSYAKAVKTIRRIFSEQKHDLLEKAASSVAESLLEEYPLIQKTVILLKKPRAPISADFEYVAVEISQERGSQN